MEMSQTQINSLFEELRIIRGLVEGLQQQVSAMRIPETEGKTESRTMSYDAALNKFNAKLKKAEESGWIDIRKSKKLLGI